MLDFLVSSYGIFIVIAIVLVLGLIGYMIDKKRYDQYRQEILNENQISNVENVEASPINDIMAAPTVSPTPIIDVDENKDQ